MDYPLVLSYHDRPLGPNSAGGNGGIIYVLKHRRAAFGAILGLAVLAFAGATMAATTRIVVTPTNNQGWVLDTVVLGNGRRFVGVMVSDRRVPPTRIVYAEDVAAGRFALAEFVDNAVQSYLANKDRLLALHGPDFRLRVDISIETAAPARP